MKIGILTFHRAYNYGAVLQCYALQEVLKGFGNNVAIIDYRQPRIEKIQKEMSLKGIVYHLIHISFLWTYIQKAIFLHQKKGIFKRFCNQYLNIKKICYSAEDISQDFDCYVIGSDQLLNTDITDGIDAVYWGFFKRPKNAKVISYALSGRLDLLEKMPNSTLEKLMHSFDAFSCREMELSNYLKRFTTKEVCTCIDPTLLTRKETWNKMINSAIFPKNNYIVLYQVRKTGEKDEVVFEKAKDFSEQNNMDLIDISSGVEVSNWISLISHANCVVTTSFHATVFALIFSRPLYAIRLGESADNRYIELLKNVGMEDCLKSYEEELITIPSVKDDLQNRLIEYQKSSIKYITDALIEN